MNPGNIMDQNQNQEEMTLSSFLEQDREMVMAQLQSHRAQEESVRVLEKEADRLMYRAGSLDGARAGAAQGMLQVLKNALPLIGSVSESEIWEKETGDGSRTGRKIPFPALLCLIAGVVCAAGSLIGQSASGGALHFWTVIWTVAGCALLALGGYLTGKGRGKEKKKEKGNRKPSRQQTFLTDPAQIWHVLQGTLLGADHSLDLMQESRNSAGNNDAAAADGSAPMQKAELQFFSDLLETAYAIRRQSPSDQTADEQVESIRYYLHERGIETEDYSAQSAKWFEMLPSDQKTVTIRPALLQNGVLIRKGLASGQ